MQAVGPDHVVEGARRAPFEGDPYSVLALCLPLCLVLFPVLALVEGGDGVPEYVLDVVAGRVEQDP